MVSANPYITAAGRLDADYFDRAYSLSLELGKPLAFDQTGYISQNVCLSGSGVTLAGSEDQQAAFVGQVLHDSNVRRSLFVVNFIGIDYGTYFGTGDVAMTWAYTGLLRQDGTAKPARAVWNSYPTSTPVAWPGR
jgi:hypothetical protein